MKIKGKIFVFVMTTASLIFFGVVYILSYGSQKNEITNAKTLAEVYAKQSAGITKSILESDLATANTIAQNFAEYDNFEGSTRFKIFGGMLLRHLKNKKKYNSTWVSWDLAALDKSYDKPFGRRRENFSKKGNTITTRIDTVEATGYKYKDLFYKLKISKQNDFILDPYKDKYGTDKLADSILVTTIISKIQTGDDFIGIVGIDMELKGIQDIINNKIPFENSEMFLLANNATFVAHSNPKLIGEKISNLYKDVTLSSKIANSIRTGEFYSFNNKDKDGKVTGYTVFAPIKLTNTYSPWSIGVTVPNKAITKNANKRFLYSLLLGLGGLIILVIVIYLISENITRPIKTVIDVIQKLGKGEIDKSNKIPVKNRKDEMSNVARSVNSLIDSLNMTAEFAIKVGRGDFTSDYKAMSDHDVLGNALLEMRSNLKDAQKVREKSISAANKRDWSQYGIAEISEILQKNYRNLGELSYTIISNLVKYLNASQGAIFFTEKNEETGNLYLNQRATYAFEKRKQLISKIEFGENLIGRCAKEKEIILLEDIPEGYTYITSGLGENTPKVLLLSPLFIESKVYGVIEIASFRKIDEYQVEFIKDVSERIASVISNIQINEETEILLERAKKQRIELEEKEEKMAKTIAELRRVKDVITIKDTESKGIMSALVSTVSVVFYDKIGRVTDMNQKNQEIFGITKKDYLGKTQFQYLPEAKEDRKWFKEFWDDLRSGKQRDKEYYVNFKGKELFLHETYTPIFDKEGNVEKIINIGIDITKQKLLERELGNAKIKKR